MSVQESPTEYPCYHPTLNMTTEQVYHHAQYVGAGTPLWLVKEHVKGKQARDVGIFDSAETASGGIQNLCNQLKLTSPYPNPPINHDEYTMIGNKMGNVFLYVKKSLLEEKPNFCDWEVRKQYYARWEIQWPFYMNSTDVPTRFDFSNSHFTG